MSVAAEMRRLHGARPPIVLVHSAGGNRHSFDAVLMHLEGREVIVPSFPGRGATPGSHCRSVAASAQWLSVLCDELGIEDAVVAGHSVGGAIAMELALGARPSLVGSLVLIATGARLRVHPAVLETLERAAARGETGDLSAWLGPDRDGSRDATPPATTLADWRMADGFDRMADVSSIRVPTTILSGTSDVLTPPKYAAFLRDAIPGARLVTLDGAGHELPAERPAEVAAALLESPVVK